MSKEKTINVYCRNNHLLFERYRKVGGGRLQKCYRDEIGRDHTKSQDLKLNQVIYCTKCEPALAVAVIKLIHGRIAYEVIPSGIRKVVT